LNDPLLDNPVSLSTMEPGQPWKSTTDSHQGKMAMMTTMTSPITVHQV
jgi:hypothetical protein